MTAHQFYSETRRLAYDQTPGRSPGVVFLGGFNSSKDGTKALHLEDWAKRTGRAFLRFDYSGHGASAGKFEDGTIGQWAEDAAAIIKSLTEGPQIIVGSSMGGWIACLLLRRMPKTFAGLVTVAAAPDFTEVKYWSGFDAETREKLALEGSVKVESPYDDEPYTITLRLIEEARDHLVMTQPLNAPCPMHILHGTADAAIPTSAAERLFQHVSGPSVCMTLVKGADHRFSTPSCLKLITHSIEVIAEQSERVS
ncbi:MAG: alpha/beta hydrolase [Pseudomonadota bacterium]